MKRGGERRRSLVLKTESRTRTREVKEEVQSPASRRQFEQTGVTGQK